MNCDDDDINSDNSDNGDDNDVGISSGGTLNLIIGTRGPKVSSL